MRTRVIETNGKYRITARDGNKESLTVTLDYRKDEIGMEGAAIRNYPREAMRFEDRLAKAIFPPEKGSRIDALFSAAELATHIAFGFADAPSIKDCLKLSFAKVPAKRKVWEPAGSNS